MEMDALKEIGNIGTGNAATTLSKLLNKDIEIIIPVSSLIKREFLKKYVLTSACPARSGDHWSTLRCRLLQYESIRTVLM